MSSKNRAGSKPDKDEDYATPPWPIHRLLDKLALKAGRWLEPCAGAGGIVRVVNTRIPGIEWVACERDPRHEASLREVVPAGSLAFPAHDAVLDDRVLIGDFFESLKKLPRRGSTPTNYPFDLVLTNPPFSKAINFLMACLCLAPDVILLLRTGFLHSRKRHAWLTSHMPERSLGLPNRPSFKPGGRTDSCDYDFNVWTPASDGLTFTKKEMLALTPRAERYPEHALGRTPRIRRAKTKVASR